MRPIQQFVTTADGRILAVDPEKQRQAEEKAKHTLSFMLTIESGVRIASAPSELDLNDPVAGIKNVLADVKKLVAALHPQLKLEKQKTKCTQSKPLRR